MFAWCHMTSCDAERIQSLTKTYLASSLSTTCLLNIPSLDSIRTLVVVSRLIVWKNPFLSISVARLAAADRSLANDHDINQSITSLPVLREWVCVCGGGGCVCIHVSSFPLYPFSLFLFSLFPNWCAITVNFHIL